MSKKPRLFLATSNPGKLKELLALTKSVAERIEVVTPQELGLSLNFEEVGDHPMEIARSKAMQAAQLSGLPSLAEDSGLFVDALDGFPGVKSARFIGKTASYTDKMRALLDLLKDLPWERRTAKFRCCMAAALPGGEVLEGEGLVEGFIAFEPAGEGGFGYDPIFFVPEFQKTAAQLSIDEKNRISHRAKAWQAIQPHLLQLLL